MFRWALVITALSLVGGLFWYGKRLEQENRRVEEKKRRAEEEKRRAADEELVRLLPEIRGRQGTEYHLDYDSLGRRIPRRLALSSDCLEAFTTLLASEKEAHKQTEAHTARELARMEATIKDEQDRKDAADKAQKEKESEERAQKAHEATVRLWVQVGLTAAIAICCLGVLISKSAGTKQQTIAAGVIGAAVAYWFK